MKKASIVIVGGGFAGIAAVKKLLRSGVQADITLVSKSDTFQYYPALYKLVTGALAIEVSVPLRRIFPENTVRVIYQTLVSVDPLKQEIVLDDGQHVPYDELVLALGSETNYFNIPGLKENSFSFKSVDEALRLKEHFHMLFATAEGKTKQELVSKLHTLIVGGGPSGVELAGDLMSFLRKLAHIYGVDPSFITIDLVESAPRVLAVMPEKVSQKAARHLRMLGVNIFTNRTLNEQEVQKVIMSSMTVDTQNVIWAAGARINSLYATIPGVTLSEKKRVVVTETLALPEYKNIFIVGDGAATERSGLAQTAIYDGNYIGTQLARKVSGKEMQTYVPPTVAYVVPVGNFWALFVYKNTVFSGLIPWLLRSIVDFRYFASIVPLKYVLDMYAQGRRYRKLECKTKFQK